jgi:hypothetical protein
MEMTRRGSARVEVARGEKKEEGLRVGEGLVFGKRVWVSVGGKGKGLLWGKEEVSVGENGEGLG